MPILWDVFARLSESKRLLPKTNILTIIIPTLMFLETITNIWFGMTTIMAITMILPCLRSMAYYIFLWILSSAAAIYTMFKFWIVSALAVILVVVALTLTPFTDSTSLHSFNNFNDDFLGTSFIWLSCGFSIMAFLLVTLVSMNTENLTLTSVCRNYASLVIINALRLTRILEKVHHSGSQVQNYVISYLMHVIADYLNFSRSD